MVVQTQIDIRPVRVISVTPTSFDLLLEPLVSVTMPVELTLNGKPAIGYKAGEISLDPAEAVISGPQSIVAQVKHLQATLDVTNARQSLDTSLVNPCCYR